MLEQEHGSLTAGILPDPSLLRKRATAPVGRGRNSMAKSEKELRLDTLYEFAVATPPGGVRRVGLIMKGSPVMPPGLKTPEARWAMSPEQAAELSIQLALAATRLGVDPTAPDDADE